MCDTQRLPGTSGRVAVRDFYSDPQPKDGTTPRDLRWAFTWLHAANPLEDEDDDEYEDDYERAARAPS
jgi:hypothetical protein